MWIKRLNRLHAGGFNLFFSYSTTSSMKWCRGERVSNFLTIVIFVNIKLKIMDDAPKLQRTYYYEGISFFLYAEYTRF